MARTPEANAAYQRAWRQRRKDAGLPLREKKSPRQEKDANLKKQYGIGIEEFDRMYEEQGGGCKICHSPIQYENRQGMHKDNSVVDHCHRTGRVRGLLCSHCNLGLGHFFDSPDLLQAAAAYLTP